MLIRTLTMGLLAAGLALAVGTPAAHAQAPRQVQVALVDSLSVQDAKAELLRFSEPGRLDIILLRSANATPDELVAAIVTLRAVSARRPTAPGVVARTTIVGHAPLGPDAAELRRRAAAILDEVRRAPVSRIGNLGRGRWGTFDVGR